jgi:hypothetical protein
VLVYVYVYCIVLFVGGTRTGRDIVSVSYGRREMVGKW